MKVVAITQARFGSTRLPGKVLRKIKDTTLLEIHINRILKATKIDKLIVASTHEVEASEIVKIAEQCGALTYRGLTNDVLDRYYQAAQLEKSDWIVRITSDCPLIDPMMIDEVINGTISVGADYGTNTFSESFPDGQDVEVFSYRALSEAWHKAQLTSEREHVTPYIRKNTDLGGGHIYKGFDFKKGAAYSGVRMTVDEEKDFQLVKTVVENMGADKTWSEYAAYIVDNKLTTLNAAINRNEGYQKSLKKDE